MTSQLVRRMRFPAAIATLMLAAAALAMIATPASAATRLHQPSKLAHVASGGLHFGPAVTRDVHGVATEFYQIKNSDNLCLDANSKAYASNGDNVQLWGCKDDREQLWRWEPNHTIANFDPTYCLDANSNGANGKPFPSNGDNIQLWTCNSSHKEQEWSEFPSAPYNAIVNYYESFCVDANSHDYGHSGDNVQLWSCNGSNEELWGPKSP